MKKIFSNLIWFNLVLLFTIYFLCTLNNKINAQSCSGLYFSEYIEGSSFNKAVEIFNSSSDSIDLTPYIVKLYSNGDTIPTFSMGLTGILASGEVYIIAHPLATLFDSTMIDSGSTAVNFNGDDAIGLYKDTILIDVIGEIGVAAVWPVGAGSTQDNTLIRKYTIQQGQTNWSVGANEWDVYPVDTDSLGLHFCFCNDTTVTLVKGIDEFDIQIYPNSDDNSLMVSIKLLYYQNLHIDIFNIIGQKVYSRKINNVKVSMLNIALNNKPEGVYFVRVRTYQWNIVNKIILNSK